jgi:hypothetical protein
MLLNSSPRKYRKKHVFTLGFAIILVSGYVYLGITPQNRSPALSSRLSTSRSCDTPGDGDIYGLGVRIGLYLQWAAGLILRLLGSWPRISEVRTANNVLCGALALATAINVVNGSALSVDYLLSYYLTIVLFYAESYNLVQSSNQEDEDSNDEWGRSEKKVYKLYPDFSLIFQNILFALYTLFGAWFWQNGIFTTRSTTCADKAAIIFVFNLRNPKWTAAATALGSIFGAIFVVILLIHLKSLNKGIMSGPELVFVRTLRYASGLYSIGDCFFEIPAVLLRPGFPTHFKLEILGERFRWWLVPLALLRLLHFSLINLVGPVVAIVSVERMITTNGLSTSGITESTGQMIALFTGVCSICIALWEFARSVEVPKTTSTSRSPAVAGTPQSRPPSPTPNNLMATISRTLTSPAPTFLMPSVSNILPTTRNEIMLTTVRSVRSNQSLDKPLTGVV